MSVVNFNIEALNKVIESSTKTFENYSEGPKTNFLAVGTHNLRIIHDPEGEVCRLFNVHQTGGKRCMCPNELNKKNEKNPKWPEIIQSLNSTWKEEGRTALPKCEICEIAQEIKELQPNTGWRSGIGIRYGNMFYCALYETSNANEYWEPNKERGNPYVIIAKGKFKNAFFNSAKVWSANSPEYILTMLNPSLSGGVISVNIESGSQGSVSVTPIMGMSKPPLFESVSEPPKWWRPLKEVSLKDEFDPIAYSEFLDLAKSKLKDAQKAVAENGPEVEDTENSSAPTNTGAISQSTPISPIINKSEVSSTNVNSNLEELAPNQRISMGKVITLPEEVVDRGCWTHFDVTQEYCHPCPIIMQCMVEQKKLSSS